MTQRTKKGILFALIAALISGISIYYNKVFALKGLDPVVFNVYKNGGVGVILTLLLMQSGQITKITRLPRKDWLKFLSVGLIGGSIPFVLFFTALAKIPAINANLIQKTLFIWAGLLAIVFLKERIKLWQIIGYALIIWANLFIGGFRGFTFNSFEGLVVIATWLWAIENIIVKKLMIQYNSLFLAWSRMTIGAIILLVLVLLQGKATLLGALSIQQVPILLGSIGLLSLYILSWYKALSLAPVTAVTAVLVLATPITNLIEAVQLGSLPKLPLLPNLVTILGVWLIAYFSFKRIQKLEPKTI